MTKHESDLVDNPCLAAVGRTINGGRLTPGYNVDRVDIAAGIKMARSIGYAQDGNETFVVEYALRRHARGEEDGAERTWLGEYPNDLTSWRMILAAAITTADHAHAWDTTVAELKAAVDG